MYTHTTFGQLKTALKNRLGDVGAVYWIDAEVELYCKEALRTWGLITGYWRDSGQFPTVSGTGLYDTTSLLNTANDPLLSYTITDTDLCTLIEYHLLEPATGGTWTGSEQFTINDLTGAIQRRREMLLLETGSVLSLVTQAITAGSQTFDLPDTTIQIRNLRWTGTSGTNWPVTQDDISGQRNYSASYLLTQGTPQTFSSSSVQPLRYVLAPPPNENGTLTLLCTQSGAALTGLGVALGVPDDMAAIVKWGAMADILGKEGPGQDLPRAYFCERRWQLGIELAKMAPVLINAQITGVSLSSDSLFNLDQYSPNWYTNTGTPTFVASIKNYIAVSPAPNGIYSILLDVVRKAIIPINDNAYVEIGREYLDPILDYAEHLAAFKCGGYEFKHTYRGAENFFAAALSYNQRLAAQNPALTTLIKQSLSDNAAVPPKKNINFPALEQAGQMSQ